MADPAAMQLGFRLFQDHLFAMGALVKRTINYRSALGIMPLAALLPLPVFRRKGWP
jgi:hypothetical protein